MSIEYRVLCRNAPSTFLSEPADFLTWDASTGSGSFGGLTLDLRDANEHDPLPDSNWTDRVVAVLQCTGHHNSNKEYDAFEDWSQALAEATHGAIYSLMADRHIYISDATSCDYGDCKVRDDVA